MKWHDTLNNKATEAIDALFADQTVGPEVTLADLSELQDKIDIMVDGLKFDVKQASKGD